MELRTKLLLLVGLAAAAGGCGGGGGSAGAPADEPVNAAPTANAGEDQYAYEGATVTLPGSGEDRDGTIASYRWEQISGPSVGLEDPDASATQFKAPAYASGDSELIFRLTVTDDRGALASDEVAVTLLPPEKADPFDHWNDLEPQTWWRESAPYSCRQEDKATSPWIEAGLADLGGSDPLSLIRYFDNGSYLRYGNMGFHGCTSLDKYPNSYHLDPPADPAYYSLGDLDIHIDIARVPADATGWHRDDGARVNFSLVEAVALLNTYVATYFRRVSQDRLRMTFHAGNEFDVADDGSPAAAEDQRNRLAGACLEGCTYGAPGGLNRILLDDVAVNTGGSAYNGLANLGLASVRNENMETIVHEIGHGWMGWPHSYAEVAWRPEAGREIDRPNPYSNFYDIMSGLNLSPILGWSYDLPSTLAINRYSAGWIEPEEVALHLDDSATYTLSNPFASGYQFLVIHSGRRFAFTTLEVLEERTDHFKVSRAEVYDPSAPGGRRSRRYEGVLVSRYDHTAGTGVNARFGPALYDRDNSNFLTDVGWGRDDFALIPHGGSREIGGGVSVSVAKNADGSYEVTVGGGKVAEFQRWCKNIWFSADEYDTGCFLDEAVWK